MAGESYVLQCACGGEQRSSPDLHSNSMPATLNSPFTRFAKRTSTLTGRPVTFILAVAVILAWALTGPLFHYSDTWQLVINTSTTIITFLMVFLIQNTQNRDTEALQIKLDELIRAMETANNALLDLEEMDDKELDRIRETYLALARAQREQNG
jgi:low affinity Fe/Cu permease